MRLQFLVPLVLILACKNKSQQDVNAANLTTPSTKADTTALVSSNRFEKFKSADYKIHTRQTIGDYTISIWQERSNDEPPYFLLMENRSTHRKDTLQLANISTLQERKVEMVDLTKAVALPPLTLALTWEGDSDNSYSEVVGYQHDTLTELFVSPAGDLVDLKRKDQWTLQGHVSSRDDIVAMPHNNYILTVSLKDFTTNVFPPDTLIIGYDTQTTDTLHTYQLSASGQKIFRTLLPGTPLHIDTFYCRQQLISLHLKDSTRLIVPHDELTQKVKGNDAG
ncbi:MAG TPA: hypothetical protein VHC96_12150 [Puia sp.]|nr:hypothetical protein [Puia sp.]